MDTQEGTDLRRKPTIFISYDPESFDVANRVRQLADRLRAEDFEINEKFGQTGVTIWGVEELSEEIRSSDCILLVCTKDHAATLSRGASQKSDPISNLHRDILTTDEDTIGKTIPIIFEKSDSRYIPDFVRGRRFFDVSGSSGFSELKHAVAQLVSRRDPFSASNMNRVVGHGAEPKVGDLTLPSELQDVKRALLASVERIAVVGQRGSGKTRIGKLLENDQELRAAFPGGVFYFAYNQSLSIQEVALKAQRDQRHTPPGKCLLIVDDVEERSDKGGLPDLGIPSAILFFTSDQALANSLATKVIQLSRPGREESREILASAMGLNTPDELPSEANQLIQMVNNDPLALRILGGILTHDDQSDRWGVLMKRLSSEQAPNQIRDPSGIFVSGLRGAVAVSLKTLEQSSQERACQLAGLNGGEDIPAAALEALWQLDEPETHELIERLARLSLAAWNGTTGTLLIPNSIIRALREINPTFVQVDVRALTKPYWRLVEVSADTIAGKDQLGISRDVNAFSSLVASKEVEPPLCIGIFGDWGTGKTFFLTKMRERVGLLSDESLKLEATNRKSAFCSDIAQINFNAWHYVDSNLWASIACRIFEGLDGFIERKYSKGSNPTAKKAELFKQLESARTRLQEAKEAGDEAQKQKANAERQLQELQQQRQAKTVKLGQVREEFLKKALERDSQIHETLQDAAKELGLQGLTDNVDKLDKALAELQGIGGRIRALGLALAFRKGRALRIALFIGVLVLIPAIGVGLHKLLDYLRATGALASLSAIIVQGSASVALLTAWLTGALRWGGKAVEKLEAAKKDADKILDSARAKPSSEELELQKDLLVLKEKETNARAAIQEAEEKVAQATRAQEALEQRADGKILAEFIRERVRGNAYQSQLGIISSIRKDLESLSELFDAVKQAQGTSQKSSDLPRIDRIILYIDDLDRCPENKVVEVLQAVHLLLYFRLFVVVIAVDSRWLLRSLEKQYFALSNANIDKTNDLDLSSTTPQNYLEKIIQIPFNLGALQPRGLQRLLLSLVPSFEDDSVPPIQPQLAQGSKAFPAPAALSEATAEVGPEKLEEGATKDSSATQARSEKSSTTDDGVDLSPEALKLTRRELEFAQKLSPLLQTPRSGKRMLNIYRLIRATVKPGELEGFFGKKGSPPQYEPVFILVAVQIGFPSVAKSLFDLVLKEAGPHSWNEFLSKLANDPGKDTSAEHQPIKGLLKCLLAMPSVEDRPIDYFQKWIPQVSRYSFRGL